MAPRHAYLETQVISCRKQMPLARQHLIKITPPPVKVRVGPHGLASDFLREIRESGYE